VKKEVTTGRNCSGSCNNCVAAILCPPCHRCCDSYFVVKVCENVTAVTTAATTVTTTVNTDEDTSENLPVTATDASTSAATSAVPTDVTIYFETIVTTDFDDFITPGTTAVTDRIVTTDAPVSSTVSETILPDDSGSGSGDDEGDFTTFDTRSTTSTVFTDSTTTLASTIDVVETGSSDDDGDEENEEQPKREVTTEDFVFTDSYNGTTERNSEVVHTTIEDGNSEVQGTTSDEGEENNQRVSTPSTTAADSGNILTTVSENDSSTVSSLETTSEDFSTVNSNTPSEQDNREGTTMPSTFDITAVNSNTKETVTPSTTGTICFILVKNSKYSVVVPDRRSRFQALLIVSLLLQMCLMVLLVILLHQVKNLPLLLHLR
jgi:hypothetical protein